MNGKTYEADLCNECVPEMQQALSRLGVRPYTAFVGGKPRGAYVTASGRSFTAAEARRWLQAAGHDVNPHGRMSKELLQTYADAH